MASNRDAIASNTRGRPCESRDPCAVPARSAAAYGSSLSRGRPRGAISHLLAAQCCDLERRDPGLLGPADALAGDLHVEQVRLALDRAGAGARERLDELARIANDLA